MAWTQEELSEIQTYLQMYDKMLVSRKTIWDKLGIDADKEEKELEKDLVFSKKLFPINAEMGGTIQ